MVYIRPLQQSDALTSYKWRNDPEVWKFTGNKPTQEITLEIESEWLRKVLVNPNTKRFAIVADDNYVGNIQLTDITKENAEYHIFIGDKLYWGKGVAKAATYKILKFAFNELKLFKVYLSVRSDNIAAIKAYERSGFYKLGENEGWVKMECTSNTLPEPMVSVFVMVYNHGKFLKEALDGIVKQSVKFTLEIVVGEDCSTDDSRSILLEYQNKYPGIFKLLLHKENIGAVENQNLILSNCKGKYLALCEGDDYWIDPLKLQKQVDFLECNLSYSLCYHNIWFLDKGKFLLKNHIGSNQTKNIRDLMDGNIVNTVSAVVRISVVDFEEISKNGAILCDYSLFLFAAMKGDMYYMKDPMAVYRYHPTSSWATQTSDKQLHGSIKVLDSVKGAFSTEINRLLRVTRNRWVKFYMMDSLADDAVFEKLYKEFVAGEEGIDKGLENFRLEVADFKEKNSEPVSISMKDKISEMKANIYDRIYLKSRGKWLS